MSEVIKKSPEQKFFADYRPENFTSQEGVTLQPFFSNLDRPIFVVHGLPESVLGALVGRHSQTPDSMRRIFLNEFWRGKEVREAITDEELMLPPSHDRPDSIATKKGNEFLSRFFAGYGHDSLAAAVPLVVGAERVTQLGVKGFEDTRLGLSPIERSTRYGFFGEKVDGRYQYAKDPQIMSSEFANLYQGEIDANIDLYVALQEPVYEAYKRKYPQQNERNLRRMTFDSTRVLLVAANFTNVAFLVNGQAAESMIFKLKASQLAEHQELGEMLQEEIAKRNPALVERLDSSKNQFGQRAIDYLSKRKTQTQLAVQAIIRDARELTIAEKGPILVVHDGSGEDKVVAHILWENSGLSSAEALSRAISLPKEEKMRLIGTYLSERPDRRSKPGRAFEEAVLTYEIICRFAEWRDLQRNRILTPSWRTLDCRFGFDIGEDLVEFGFGEAIGERLNRLAEVHARIAEKYPLEAQYMVPFGALMPYRVTLNFRELVHLAELRTGPGAHASYAKIASEMARQAREVYPLLGKAFQFVNWR